MGTISRPFRSRQSSMVRPTFLSLWVAGSHLTWILNPWWSPVTRYRCLTSPAAHYHLEGPAAVADSKGSCTPVPMAYSGYRAAASSSVQLFDLAFGLGPGLACAGALRFFAPHGQIRIFVARSQQKKMKNQEKDAQAEKIKPKIDFSDLRNPRKKFTPLFGEVAKFRTLTEKEEQQSRDGDEVERCLPQNT